MLTSQNPTRPTLSICIPTRNRSTLLANCLNSLCSARERSQLAFQICVSDNNSDDNTETVVRQAQQQLTIQYRKQDTNVGFARNLLSVVSMATGDFVWAIGDDDLLMPDAISRLFLLMQQHPLVDFFYVNSFLLDADYLAPYPHPFDTDNLPKLMSAFSTFNNEGEMPFLDLINPDVSFDFLGGIFLSVFRKRNWDLNTHVLNGAALMDDRVQSHFDNTFPQIKIFANAYRSSRAYFNAAPLIVSLSGSSTREWAPMYPLVRSVRLLQGLQAYRSKGLPYWKYLRCKNRALKHFVPDLIRLLLDRENSGYRYINPLLLVLESFLFPNFYLSVISLVGRKLRSLTSQTTR